MINRDQANEIAQSLMQEARAESSQKLRKVAARNSVTDRIRTAIITLLGYGFGWQAADSWLGLGEFAPLVAVVTALWVAVVFPLRKQT